jgi:hypothetical protein
MPPDPTINTVQHSSDLPNIVVEHPDTVSAAFKTEPSRWRTTKKTMKHTATATGVGIQVTQQVLGTTTMIALFSAGAAISATGIGLIVGAAAITLGTMTASARSLYKTHQHIKGLRNLQERGRTLPCDMINMDGSKAACDPIAHAKVSEALEYVINKKIAKRGKKGAGTVGLSAFTGVFSIGKAIYKHAKGTKGVNRMAHANDIAVHLVTHNCALAQGIAAELYSVDEMLWMLDQDSPIVTKLLADKMQST